MHTSHYSRLEKPTVPLDNQEKLPRKYFTLYLSLRIRTTDASHLERISRERKEDKGKERKEKEAEKKRKKKGKRRKDKKSKKRQDKKRKQGKEERMSS